MKAQAKPQPLCPIATAKAKDDLSIITTLLLSPGAGSSSPKTFYAHFLMRMNVVFTNKVPTAGVSITDKLNFYINPEYFNNLDNTAKQDLVEHEIEHIVYKHPIRAQDFIGGEYNQNTHKLFNYATDANINHTKLTSADKHGWVTIDRLNESLKQMGSKDRLDPKDAAEIHYETLKRNQLDPDPNGTGEGMADDHSTWDESTNNKEVAEAIIKDASNKAQAATGVGNMPEHILREIAAMNKSLVNWKRELRQFFVNSLKFDFERTRTKRNRRDVLDGVLRMQGRRKKPHLHVAMCVDSSGSMFDEAFAQAHPELCAIHDMGVKITVIDADSGVAAVYDFDPKKPFQRHGNGGTAYQPAITKAMELEVDGIIYFGDMDASDTPNNPGVPFLWAIVGSQNPPANFGRSVRIELERGRG